MDNTVEFKFHIQEMPNKNLVGKFVDKIKTRFVSKGLVEHKDYEIEIESDDLPIIRNEMMVGGATDSTFPYSIIEGLLDYIDDNVRVIKRENIQTDEYEKEVEKKRRLFDGLFTRGKTIEGEIQNQDEKPPVLPNTWDKLFVDVQKTDDQNEEKSTVGFLDKLFPSNIKPNTENKEIGENAENKEIGENIENKEIGEKPKKTFEHLEKEKIVKILLNSRINVIIELGERSLLKI